MTHWQRIPRRPQATQLGMSLIEVLIGVAIMFVVAIGIIPLFARSIRQNREGYNYTEITNIARSSLEELVQDDFNSPELTITAGNQKVTKEVFDRSLKRWVAAGTAPVDPSKPHLYERWVTIEQFSAGDFKDDGYLDSPLAAGSDPTTINIKRIRVMVRPMWGAWAASASFLLGAGNPVTLEAVKAV